MDLEIPRYGDGPDFSKLTKYLRDKDGLPIGRSHNNPILDKQMYEVEYKYSQKALLAANVIVEKIFSQVNGEGNQHIRFQEIVVHRYNGTEVKKQGAFITTPTGTKCHRETTKGVEFLVQWKDGITKWVTLKYMKN